MIEKKEFAAVVFDQEHRAFVIYIATLNVDSSNEIYLFKRAQIAYLKGDEAFIKVPSKYAFFVGIFSPKFVAKLSKHTRINDYVIKLVNK